MQAFVSIFQYFLGINPISESTKALGEYDHIHMAQRFSWDCGVACCNMIINWLNSQNLVFVVDPFENDSKRPLWTIDLYVMLKKRGVDAVMSTSFKGVNENHANIEWYKGLEVDRKRVVEMFSLVEQRCWSIEKEMSTIDLVEILKSQTHLRIDEKRTLALVLVDYFVMTQRENTFDDIKCDYTSSCDKEAKNSEEAFIGHYILVVGWCSSTSRIEYLDPATDSRPHYVSPGVLDISRRSKGTDMDLITITNLELQKKECDE